MAKVYPKGEKGATGCFRPWPATAFQKVFAVISDFLREGCGGGGCLVFGFHGFEAIGGVVFFGDVARGFALVGFEVGVGAMAEQEGDQGGVVAGGGQQEGGEALLGGGVGIGSGREKTFTGFEAAFVGGVKEGGRTKVIRGIHIDVCLKQGFQCREVAVPSSVHERGEMGATLGFAVFGVGPRRDEVLDPFGVIGIYGIPKCRPATVVRQIGVGLMIEQGFDGVGFFVGNGIVQGGGVLSAPRIDVGAITSDALAFASWFSIVLLFLLGQADPRLVLIAHALRPLPCLRSRPPPRTWVYAVLTFEPPSPFHDLALPRPMLTGPTTRRW